MPSNRCSNCQSIIFFVPGKGFVTRDGEKCTPNKHVTAPHIPLR